MIVSHEHRFVFVQVPQTGSTAIGDYLVEIAGGQDVLRKHTTLAEARRALGPAIDGYRVVGTVRHPVDQVVSSFYKLRTDHHRQLARPDAAVVGPRAQARLEWASAPDRTFDEFLTRFLRHVFAPVHVRSLRRADLLLRFEHLDRSVEELLAFLGVAPAGPLPRINATDRPADLELGPAAARHLADRCGPFMAEFGYAMVPPAVPSPRWRVAARRLEYEAAIAAKSMRRWRNGRLLKEKAARAGY